VLRAGLTVKDALLSADYLTPERRGDRGDSSPFETSLFRPGSAFRERQMQIRDVYPLQHRSTRGRNHDIHTKKKMCMFCILPWCFICRWGTSGRKVQRGGDSELFLVSSFSTPLDQQQNNSEISTVKARIAASAAKGRVMIILIMRRRCNSRLASF
jgi:hypothetical protein